MLPAMSADAPAEIREAAVARGLDSDRVELLLATAPGPWATSADPEDLAADLALLASPLGAEEVRLRISAVLPAVDTWELAIVAHDRPGLLALTASVAAAHDLSISSARIASWGELSIALQRVRVVAVKLPLSGEPEWPFIGQELRSALTGPAPTADAEAFLPAGCIVRSITPGRLETHWIIDIDAPDEVGLLARVAATLLALGADVMAADIRSANGRALDTFLVQLDDALGLRAVQALAAQSQMADTARRMTLAS